MQSGAHSVGKIKSISMIQSNVCPNLVCMSWVSFLLVCVQDIVLPSSKELTMRELPKKQTRVPRKVCWISFYYAILIVSGTCFSWLKVSSDTSASAPSCTSVCREWGNRIICFMEIISDRGKIGQTTLSSTFNSDLQLYIQ